MIAAAKAGRQVEATSVPLARWLGQSFRRAAIVPLLVIECTFLGVYWLSGHLAYQRNEDALEAISTDYLSDMAGREASAIQAQLGGIEIATNVLARQTLIALDQPSQPSAYERARHGFGQHGIFYSYRGDRAKDAASFYSGYVPVSSKQIDKVWRTAALDPLMRSIASSSPLVRQVYFNSWDSYNRIYPYIDVSNTYAPKMNIPSYNFYYEADTGHNPAKKTVWTDAYVDPAHGGWMVSAIAPVYRTGRLEGVVGIDLTLETVVRRILALDLPWRGYGILIGRDGAILALPPQAERDLGLREMGQHHYADVVRSNMFKPDAFNTRKRKDLAPLARLAARPGQVVHMVLSGRNLLATSARIDGAGWTLVLIAPASQILASAIALRQQFETAGIIMLAILLLFYCVFFIILFHRSQRMSQRMAEPLQGLERIMERIGAGEYGQQAISCGVSELDGVADRLVAMGRTLGIAHRQIMDQQDAVSHAYAVEKQVTQGQRRFIRLLSHEVRTPLTMIDSCGQILHRRASRLNPEDLSERGSVIRQAADQITAIMDRAISLLQLDEAAVEVRISPVSIRDLLDHVMRPLSGTGIRFVTDVADGDQILWADARLIEATLNALLDNAVKFSSPQGTITITVQREDGDCHIRVADQGHGIDPDELALVTERFFRGRKSMAVPGIGVGLFMAKSWIGAHGGELGIQSRVGEGTMVEIRLKNVLRGEHERGAA